MIIVGNFLSPALDDLARAFAAALSDDLGEETRFESDATLDEFREGGVGIALVCGLAYALLRDAEPERFAPVAAPVVGHPQAPDDAVYFSEIVVPAGSTAAALAELAGARFAYNETVSFSGYRALEHALAGRDLSWSFFGERTRTGGHRGSLDALIEGRADLAAIDSHVLILERMRDPSLADTVKVVESLGPYPAPPLAINRIGCDLSEGYLSRVLDKLGEEVLDTAAIDWWQRVDDAYYDPIRDVTRGLPDLGL